MGNTATISSEFQISIPEEVRISQNWKAGQVLAFVPKGAGFVLVPVPGIEDLRGIAKGASLEDYRDRSDRTKRWKFSK